MNLKEVGDIFAEIFYFKGLENRDDYYQEFIYFFGEREILYKIETLYNESGVEGIGKLFTLKTKKWVELAYLEEKIKELERLEKTVSIKGIKQNKGDKSRTTNTNNTNEVIPFDIKESIENEKNRNVIYETEVIIDNFTIVFIFVYTDFSKEKIDYFLKKFKNYSEYRYIIYKDIINMITLQVY